MTDERRVSPRTAAYLAAEIETEGGHASVAITRDGSATGLLVLTRQKLNAGDHVKLKVAFGSEVHQLAGRVVRLEELDPELSSLWHNQAAIAIDTPNPRLAELFARVAEQHGGD